MSLTLNGEMTEKQKQEPKQKIWIIKSWRDSKKSKSLVFCLPKDIGDKYDIDKPCSLYLIPRSDGILLRKVDLESVK